MSGLKQVGPTGLVTVLIGLKWWGIAGKVSDSMRWELAVLDVVETLELLLTGNSGKQKAVNNKNTRRTKKVKV